MQSVRPAVAQLLVESKRDDYHKSIEEGEMTEVHRLQLIAKDALAVKERLSEARQTPRGCFRVCCPHWTLVLPGTFSLFLGSITGRSYWMHDEFGEIAYPIGTFLSLCLYGVLWRCAQKAKAGDIILAGQDVVDVNVKRIENSIPPLIERVSGLQTRTSLLQIKNSQLQTENKCLKASNSLFQSRNRLLQTKNNELTAGNSPAENGALLAENRELLAENRDLHVENNELENLKRDLQIVVEMLLESEAKKRLSQHENRELQADNSELKARNRQLQIKNSGLQDENSEIERLTSNPQVADMLACY